MSVEYVDTKEKLDSWFVSETPNNTPFMGKHFKEQKIIKWKFTNGKDFDIINKETYGYGFDDFIRDYKLTFVSEKYLLLRGWL